MKVRSLMIIKTILATVFSSGSTFASDTKIEAKEIEKSKEDIKHRLDVIKKLELDYLTDSEKRDLIEELLESNEKVLKLIPNNVINSRIYRNEAGSHSFSM